MTTDAKPRIGTDLMVGVCLVVLWWQAGVSFWWFAGLWLLGWLINLLPMIRKLLSIAEQIKSKAMLDTLHRVEENAKREAEELRQRSLRDRGHGRTVN